MNESRDMVSVYVGEQMACIRIQLALGSHDIPTELDTGMTEQRGGWGCVLVDLVDLERATTVIEALDAG
jgi:hypothetical protein